MISQKFMGLLRIAAVCGLMLLGAFPIAAQEIAPSHDQVWATYSNEQFGVASVVPSVGFLPQQADSGAGVSLLSESGHTIITVFGSNWIAVAPDFASYRNQQGQMLENLGANITYAPGGRSWFVFSGFLEDDVFYFKSTTRSNCPVAGHIYFKFPAIYKEQMDYIIERMEDSLHLAPSEACPG